MIIAWMKGFIIYFTFKVFEAVHSEVDYRYYFSIENTMFRLQDFTQIGFIKLEDDLNYYQFVKKYVF